MKILNSLKVPINVKGLFRLFQHRYTCKIPKKRRGTLLRLEKISEKRLTKPKNGRESLIAPKNWKGTYLCFVIPVRGLLMRSKSNTEYFGESEVNVNGK